MIGVILYESIEAIMTITKMTYNGIHASYCWYYDIQPEEQSIHDKDKVIQELLIRIEELEKKQTSLAETNAES